MLLSAYDAVLFDLDGVLDATTELHAACWKATFDRAPRRARPSAPFDVEPRLPRTTSTASRATTACATSSLASRGVDAPGAGRRTAIGSRKQALVEQALERDGVDAFPGSVALGRAAAPHRPAPTAVVTSSANGDAVLRAAGISDLFDLTVDGRDIVAPRAAAASRRPTASSTPPAASASPPRRAVVVEDALAGVAAGRAGGFGLVIGVARNADAR